MEDVRSEAKFICPLCLATRARGSAMLDLDLGLWDRFAVVDADAGSGSGSAVLGVRGVKAGEYPARIIAVSWGLNGHGGARSPDT